MRWTRSRRRVRARTEEETKIGNEHVALTHKSARCSSCERGTGRGRHGPLVDIGANAAAVNNCAGDLKVAKPRAADGGAGRTRHRTQPRALQQGSARRSREDISAPTG